MNWGVSKEYLKILKKISKLHYRGKNSRCDSKTDLLYRCFRNSGDDVFNHRMLGGYVLHYLDILEFIHTSLVSGNLFSCYSDLIKNAKKSIKKYKKNHRDLIEENFNKYLKDNS